jgi:hypothetical protein
MAAMAVTVIMVAVMVHPCAMSAVGADKKAHSANKRVAAKQVGLKQATGVESAFHEFSQAVLVWPFLPVPFDAARNTTSAGTAQHEPRRVVGPLIGASYSHGISRTTCCWASQSEATLPSTLADDDDGPIPRPVLTAHGRQAGPACMHEDGSSHHLRLAGNEALPAMPAPPGMVHPLPRMLTMPVLFSLAHTTIPQLVRKQAIWHKGRTFRTSRNLLLSTY